MQPLELIRAQIAATCARVGRDPAEITLVGASKTVEAARLEAALGAGLTDFGENYISEGVEKVRAFRERGLAATWHFIGALQSNKARAAVAHFDLIHSVDRLSLAKELDKAAQVVGKTQRVLVQVNVGGEASKAGVAPESLGALLDALTGFSHLQVEGLMSLPPFRENPEESRPYHRELRVLKDTFSVQHPTLTVLSMGMSRDFAVAIEEGATIVRVGTALFGARS